MFVAIMLVTFSTAANDCLDQQQAGIGPPNVPVAGEGTVRVAQANIKVSLPRPSFRADLDQTLSTGPDLVSLNEVSRRSEQDLTRRGYAHYRAPNRGDDGSAVMWRTDRWTKVDAGRIVMVANGPQQWDYDRGATWVTLQSTGVDAGDQGGTGLGQVSMVSLHHMINPAKYGPNMPLRQQLYRQGLEKVQALVTRLSASGPVFVAGDFNSQYGDNDPWGPRKMLGAIGMKPTFDQLGKESTHNGGGIIDYVFYQPAVATPTRQWTRSLNSDHRLVVADLAVGSGAGGTAGASNSRTGNPSSAAVGDVGGADVRRRLMQVKFAPSDPGYPTMSAEQADNAIAIGQVALDELDLPPRALEIAIATAIQESKLTNLDGGDRDSAGLFQQRPSTGWGSHDQVTNPELATLAFFGRATHTNNPGLLDIPGWTTLPLTEAAQQVQRSGYPDAYAQWETAAQEIAAVLAGGDLGSPLNIIDAAAASSNREDCAPEDGAAAYTVGTLNLLGAGHTDGGRGKQHPGFAGWEARLPKALAALRAGGVSVAGLQEVHPPEQKALVNDGTWEVYPRSGKQNVVAWDPSAWEMTNARLVPIPYFGGKNVGMPLVQLTSRVDGQSIWVWSIHNPANAHGPAAQHRIEALRRQAAELEPLVTAGQPVFIVGDFNDGKDGPNRAHCALTPLLENAFGGPADPCKTPPRDAPIDHIFGANVSFASAAVDRSTQQGKVSDHPLVTASIGGGDTSCPPTNSPAEEGLTPDALLVLRCVDSQFGPHTYGGVGERSTNPDSDHPAGRAVDIMINAWNSPGGIAEGTRIAAWVREHAKELGVTYIIWRARIWSVTQSSDGWRPYSHPSGATDPTSLHMDHVHVSVHGSAGTGLVGASGDVVYPVPASAIGTDAHNWHASGSYWSNWHTGTDFSVACGTPVLAAHAGTIDIDRSQSWAGRWLVKVTTGPSSLTTWYAHMHTLTVEDGDQVQAGQQIGAVGGDSPLDGNVSGCHLHFEVHLENGSIYGADNVDPTTWLAENARQSAT
ncbi:MAG: endonuclease/exonuclease/phosphatase family protein [Nocardioides sp.]